MIDRRNFLGSSLTAAMVAGLPAGARAQPSAADAPAPLAPSPLIDDLARAAMKTFEVPGLALSIVEVGKPAIAKGYGVRSLETGARVDGRTLFPIGSNTKAFTAAALALLVDEGRIGWDDAVVKHMPSFRMYDDHTTRELTVRDLLSHRSGLGAGQGDLMFWPRTDFSRAEIVERLRYLKPVSSFRAGYAYDNLLYIAAGELIAAITGTTWEQFVATRLLQPLGMTNSAPGAEQLRSANRAAGHARLGGPLRGIGGKMQPVRGKSMTSIVNPSGGIFSSASDMGRWLDAQLNRGKLPGGKQLWSDKVAGQMWRGQTIMGASPARQDNEALPHFVLYALGWVLQDYRGVPILTHTGGLAGAVSRTALVPSRGFGFSILTNAEEEGAHTSLYRMLLDKYLGLEPVDWIGRQAGEDAEARASYLKDVQQAQASPLSEAARLSLPLAGYAGRYRDAWYGDVLIRHGEGALSIDFTRSPDLKGRLEPSGPDRFRTRFSSHEAEDAYVQFKVGTGGAIEEVTLNAVSPFADFSFDYGDLLLRRVT